MRLLGRLLGGILLAALAIWGLNRLLAADPLGFLGRDREAWKLELVPQASVSVTYVARPDTWLSFAVPGGTNQVRLITNANLRDLAAARALRQADPRQRWRYALDIELTDRKGRILLSRRQHYRADIAEMLLPTGMQVTPAYYLDEQLSPAQGVIVNLNLAGLPPAAHLRVRAQELDAGLADVAVRAYFPEAIGNVQAEHLWQRLSERQKAALGKGSVYPHELLTLEERGNLLKSQWAPAGAQGARGRDFQQREMYVLRDVDGEPVDEPVPPAGVIAGPGRPAVFPLPASGGRVRFEARRVDPHDSGVLPPPEGRWYGDNPFARETFALPLAHEGQVWRGERTFAAGLVEIESAGPLALRAFATIDGAEREITPEREYKRMFIAGSSEPVDYAIAGFGNAPTPVRVEARHIPGAEPAPVLRYEFLAGDGTPLKSGTLAMVAEASPYDEPMNLVGARISEPTEAYFAVPPAATTLRLSTVCEASSAPVLVAVANRPARLPRLVRVPEDRFDFDAKGKRVPAWFTLRPNDYALLFARNRSQLVAVQARPPEDNPALLSGRFALEDLRRSGDFLARSLLAPREPGTLLRDEALPSVFAPLAPGRAVSLDFPQWLGVRRLTPMLAWAGGSDEPLAITLSVDGRPLQSANIRGGFGKLRLQPMPAGPHVLRLDITPGTGKPPRFFINHVRPGPDSYLMRLAVQVEREAVFAFQRNGAEEETISARLFHPAGWQGRSRITLRVDGPPAPVLAPQAGWLFEERDIDVRPDPSYAAPVFDAEGERRDAGQAIFFTIPEGAPAGTYRLRLRIESGPPAYLAVGRLIPGEVVRRRIIEESGIGDANTD